MILKTWILVALMVLSTYKTFAQAKNTYIFKHNVCGFSDAINSTSIDYEQADSVTAAYIQRICSIAGIENKFNIEKAPIKTAASTYDEDLGRCIFYSAGFFTVDSTALLDVDERKILILAHEIGHFLNNDILPVGPLRMEAELDADRFAGAILCKMSLHLSDATVFLDEVCDEKANSNYPSREMRKKALEEGFRRANCNGDNAPPSFEREEVMKLLRLLYPKTIFFEYDTSVLDTPYYKTLDTLARQIIASDKSILLKCFFSTERLDITGVNVSGTAAYATRISRDIGNAVKTYLVRAGVNTRKIIIKSYGINSPNRFPINRNSEFGRQLNRRVEIEILDSFDRPPPG